MVTLLTIYSPGGKGRKKQKVEEPTVDEEADGEAEVEEVEAEVEGEEEVAEDEDKV